MRHLQRPKNDPDRAIISTAAKALRLYARYHQLDRETEHLPPGPGGLMHPGAEAAAEAAEKLLMALRHMPASTIEALAAKASVFIALDDPGSSGPEYPMGTDGIARSICADLARLTRSPAKRWKTSKEFR